MQLAENASDIVFRYRYKPTRGFEYINPAVAAITGFSPEECYNDPCLGTSVVHPDDRPLLETTACDTALVTDPLTFRLVRKDGATVWVERRVIPILNQANEIVAIEGIVRDITQRIRTQQVLEREVAERTQEIERRRRVAESLRETLHVLNSEFSTAEILDHIVGQAIPVLGGCAAAIYRLNAAEQRLRIRSAKGLDPDYVARISIPVGKGPVGEAVLHRRPVAVGDVPSRIREMSGQIHPEVRALVERLAAQYHALIAVPLIVKDEIYGGLVVYYTTSREFSDEEIGLTVALGHQAALAIENARLRAHAQEAAAAEERTRLARELHDSVTQTLFSVNLIAGVLPRVWERNPQEGRHRLQELRQLARGALAEMRTLLLELRPDALLKAEMADLLQQLGDAAAGRSRLDVSVSAEGEGSLPAEVRVALYRIAQEALNNAAKHSAATRSTLTARWTSDSATVRISDEGRGFDPMGIGQGHLGLGIMETIGAALQVTSNVGRGTTVEVVWPAGAAAVR
jgi:PAS domain S-box-containing protein